VLLVIDEAEGTLTAYRDKLGLLPLFVAGEGSQCIVMTECKCLLGTAYSNLLRLKPWEQLRDQIHFDADFTPFRSISKVEPGGMLRVDANQKPLCYETKDKIRPLSEKEPAEITSALDAVLRQSVSSRISMPRFGCALSGGLDSAIVSSLARTNQSPLETFCVGLRDYNEFDESRKSSSALGTLHWEMTVPQESVVDGIVSAIYYNEIVDALSAEIAALLWHLYRLASLRVDELLSGYGADLLFGGMLTTQHNPDEVNGLCATSILRTLWTGEFSPYLAHAAGVDVKFPYWNTALIELAMATPGSSKISHDVKVILREWAENFGVLPRELVWRKKRAIHEAASIDHLFAEIVNASSKSDYKKKGLFTYLVMAELFENGRSVDDLKLTSLIDRVRGW
jgi:carbapenam-3-carboxylate synthase